MKVDYSYLLEQFKVEEGEAKVKYVDLPKQANVEATLNDVKELLLKTGQFTLGQPVTELESKFAQLCKTKYAIGVNSSFFILCKP